MKTIKVYMAGTQAVHLAENDEHWLNKKHAVNAHCGGQTAEMTLNEIPLENLKLSCEACNYQVELLQQVKRDENM
jgi:hypothetical protein